MCGRVREQRTKVVWGELKVQQALVWLNSKAASTVAAALLLANCGLEPDKDYSKRTFAPKFLASLLTK